MGGQGPFPQVDEHVTAPLAASHLRALFDSVVMLCARSNTETAMRSPVEFKNREAQHRAASLDVYVDRREVA